MTIPVSNTVGTPRVSETALNLSPLISAPPEFHGENLARQTPQSPSFSQSVRLSKGDGSILSFPTLATAVLSLDLDLRLI